MNTYIRRITLYIHTTYHVIYIYIYHMHTRSLIQDQIEGMEAIGVRSVCLNSTQDFETVTRGILNELRNLDTHDGIKLLYITPEKLSKSAMTVSVLQDLYHRGKLSRFVVGQDTFSFLYLASSFFVSSLSFLILFSFVNLTLPFSIFLFFLSYFLFAC